MIHRPAALAGWILCDGGGATWTKSLNSVAASTRLTPPPAQVNEPLYRPVDKGSGFEAVRVEPGPFS
jgi:hypothetical protein